MIKKIFIVLSLLPFLAYSQQAMVTDTLTIEQAVDIALDKNYSVRIARSNEQLLRNDYSYRNYGLLPSITAAGTKSSNYNIFFEQTIRQSNDTVSNPPRDFSNTTNSNTNASVNLNWVIFDGMGMFIAYKQLAEAKAAGFENTKISLENTVALVSNAYYNIIQLQEKVSAFADALKISQQRLELAKAQYEVGAGSKLNYLAAQVDYNTDKSALIGQEQFLKNAKISLNELLGRDASVEYLVSDTIIVNENLNIDVLKQSAIQSNSSLLFAQRNNNIAYLNIKATQAQRFPVVSLFSGLTYSKASNGAGFLSGQVNESFNYGITASLNIFNGFEQNRRIQNAKIQRDISEARIAELKVQLEADLQRAYTDYQNSLNLISLEKQNLEVARQNIDIALERYKLGVSTPLELREVQRNAVATESRLIDAEYSAKLAEIELLRLSSRIIQ
jgi:outer membrane protein TolC